MNRKSEEQELNEILDRMVAGEKVAPGPDTSAEMREKILAAEKLLECTADPSTEFEKRLKSRLVNRFGSREAAGAASKSGWDKFLERLGNLVPIAPAWRAAAAAVTVGLLALAVVWAAGLLPFGTDVPPVVGTTPPAIIKVEPAAPGTISAPAGSEVRVELLFRNAGTGAVRIDPFPPEISISSPLDRTPLRVFAPGEGDITILPSGKAAYTLIWDQRDSRGQYVPPGTYTVSVMGISLEVDGTPQPGFFDAASVALIEILPG